MGRNHVRAKNIHKRIPFGIKLSMLMKGFNAESYYFYNLEINDRKDYIPDIKLLLKCSSINQEYSNILDNKLTFAYFFRNEDRIIKPLIFTNKGKFINFKSGVELDDHSLISLLKNGKFILKAAKGGGGNGIYLLDTRDKEYILNNKKSCEQSFLKFIRKTHNYLIFNFIQQDGFAHELNPSSVNTLRIITMNDPVTNEIFIPFAGFRCGRKSSFIDNTERGGCGHVVDVEKGIIRGAPALSPELKLIWEIRHPDFNLEISGIKIPNWEKIKKEIIEFAQRNSFISYVGWDVVPMENDFLIIEGNSHPSLFPYQSYSPILKSEKIKNFYKHYQVI